MREKEEGVILLYKEKSFYRFLGCFTAIKTSFHGNSIVSLKYSCYILGCLEMLFKTNIISTTIMTIEWRVTYGKLQSTYRREKEKQMRELEVPGS